MISDSSHFWIEKVSRNRKNDKTPENNDFSRDLAVFLFLDTFEYRKCFEKEKWQNPWKIMTFSMDLFILFLETFEYRNCLETGKITKPLENNDFVKGFGCSSVSRHFWIQEVSGNRRNDKIPWNNNFFQGIWSFLLLMDIFDKGKVSGNRKNDQVPWKQ